MKNAVVYVRVSSDEQTEGSSLDLQEAACRAYCEKRGMTVRQVFRDEGESAKSANRPKFQDMIRYCGNKRNRIDHVVVHKTDRFARVAEDYYFYTRTLREGCVTLLSTSEEVDGGNYVQKLMRGILAHVAEFDNDVRADRSKQAMVKIAENGGWCFRAPLGYRRARLPEKLPVLEPDPVTGPLVRKLFEAIVNGRRNICGIRDYAESLGLQTGHGKQLHQQTIHKMLHNPVYAGRIEGQLVAGRSVKAAFPGLVSEATFDRVQAILAGCGHVPSPHLRNNPDFPLRRFVLCAACGKPLTGSNATGRSGKLYPQYRCAKKDCRAVNVGAVDMTKAFLKLLYEIRIETSPLLQRFREKVLDEWQLRHAEVITAQATLKDNAKALKKKQALLLDKMLEGTVDEQAYTVKNAELSKQIYLARAKYQEAAGEEWDIETALDLACLMVQNAGRLWYEMNDLNHRQRLQKALFPDGLKYSQSEGFGTAANTYPARVLQEFSAGVSQMAPPRGIEPLFSG